MTTTLSKPIIKRAQAIEDIAELTDKLPAGTPLGKING